MYLDYRRYLGELFAFHKQQEAHFSYRYFSKKAGFASPNFLKLVIDGQRNLSHSSVAKVAKGFGLKKKEREFFENMVFMNQADTHAEKNRYYRKMMIMAAYRKHHTIEQTGDDYFSTWYYPAIRELIACGRGDRSAGQMADMLVPKISRQACVAALELLEQLGLIKKDAQGAWQPEHGDITTGPEIRSLVIANYHREMLKLATESLERFPAGQRDISSLSLGIRRDRMDEFKQRLRDFRKELLQLAAEDEQPDQVIQVNIQMFPLTR